MSERTGIEWTDSTWNPTRGCSRVSEGCRNCYAERFAARAPAYQKLVRSTPTGPKWTGKVELAEHALTTPLRWRKPRRIFVDSMSDLFHEAVPDAWIDRIFAVMEASPRHAFQVLTKRPERMKQYILGARDRVDDAGEEFVEHLTLEQVMRPRWPLPNVWLGTSVENQAAARARIPDLIATPAARRFLSCEPLLGPIDLTDLPVDVFEGEPLHWVIAGGESGPGARPMRIDWARELRGDCVVAGIPFFFKQWGEWIPLEALQKGHGPLPNWAGERKMLDGAEYVRIGKRAAGNLLDGQRHEAFPT